MFTHIFFFPLVLIWTKFEYINIQLKKKKKRTVLC